MDQTNNIVTTTKHLIETKEEYLKIRKKIKKSFSPAVLDIFMRFNKEDSTDRQIRLKRKNENETTSKNQKLKTLNLVIDNVPMHKDEPMNLNFNCWSDLHRNQFKIIVEKFDLTTKKAIDTQEKLSEAILIPFQKYALEKTGKFPLTAKAILSQFKYDTLKNWVKTTLNSFKELPGQTHSNTNN